MVLFHTASLTDFIVGRILRLRAKGMTDQDEHPLFKRTNMRMESDGVDTHLCTIKTGKQPPLDQYIAKHSTNNPTMMRTIFLADSFTLPTSSIGMRKKDPRGGSHSQFCGIGKKSVRCDNSDWILVGFRIIYNVLHLLFNSAKKTRWEKFL